MFFIGIKLNTLVHNSKILNLILIWTSIIIMIIVVIVVFHQGPTLINHAGDVDKILESWKENKMAVPTYGAIILDPTLQHVSKPGKNICGLHEPR